MGSDFRSASTEVVSLSEQAIQIFADGIVFVFWGIVRVECGMVGKCAEFRRGVCGGVQNFGACYKHVKRRAGLNGGDD